MLRLIVSRLIFMVLAAFLLLSFLFALFHLIPGDPAQLMAGDNAPEHLVQSIRAAYGFDQPLTTQYFNYMGKVLQGDFGLSNYSRQPVLDIVFPRIVNTAALAGCAMLLAMTTSLILGSFSAMFWNRPLDKGVTVVSLIGICTPVFVTGIIGIYVFAVWLRWLPIGGMSTWKHFVLPVATLGAYQAAIFTRMVRSCMVDALSRDFITTARAKGAPERTVVFHHALRNALLPIITLFGLGLGHTLGGSVVTETIFNWPGLGRLMVDAILSRDLPVLQGSIFFFAIIFILVNLIVDILYTWADPRISYD
ncbi:ABC transporter permease [Oceaniovalibus sp. ACAM 378]|uniref:ABC transporter permease n=1 Tax=Oceaniovalibus sp. ACAM 378 TaxID=2599923 RepID=UPI0011D58B6D|nr:ABC transporter permease [Oceaniovalibus sp. ACAM 378]TYB83905.1 ABC transporter permease [Oceaniovalibus sp. ACAM 378]